MNRRRFIQLASGAAAALSASHVVTLSADLKRPAALPMEGQIMSQAEWPELVAAMKKNALRYLSDEMEYAKRNMRYVPGERKWHTKELGRPCTDEEWQEWCEYKQKDNDKLAATVAKYPGRVAKVQDLKSVRLTHLDANDCTFGPARNGLIFLCRQAMQRRALRFPHGCGMGAR